MRSTTHPARIMGFLLRVSCLELFTCFMVCD
jgi:hypothetical protein